jgi:hypothetical protein
MEKEITKAANPPGYARTLDRAQAQGSLYLRAAGSGILGFAPGVGKTDTAVAAALELMAQKPGTRVLVVAPPTALSNAWAKTIQQTCPGTSIQILGQRRGGTSSSEDIISRRWRTRTPRSCSNRSFGVRDRS